MERRKGERNESEGESESGNPFHWFQKKGERERERDSCHFPPVLIVHIKSDSNMTRSLALGQTWKKKREEGKEEILKLKCT